MNAIPSILGLLSHENTDIVADTLELLAELSGAEVGEDKEDEAQEAELEADGVKLLIDTIVENRGLGLVEQARERERSNAICVSIYKMCVQRVRKRFRWVDG